MARAHCSNRLIDRTAGPSPNSVIRSSAVGSLCTPEHVVPSFRVRCALWNLSMSEPLPRNGL